MGQTLKRRPETTRVTRKGRLYPKPCEEPEESIGGLALGVRRFTRNGDRVDTLRELFETEDRETWLSRK